MNYFPEAFSSPPVVFLDALNVNKLYGGWNTTTERLFFLNGIRTCISFPTWWTISLIFASSQVIHGARRPSRRMIQLARGRISSHIYWVTDIIAPTC